MLHDIDAIYENGVFRPLTPLALPERTPAKITVDAEVHAIEIEQQRAALARMFQKVDALPQHRNEDGWSVDDHDALLYGDDT